MVARIHVQYIHSSYYCMRSFTNLLDKPLSMQGREGPHANTVANENVNTYSMASPGEKKHFHFSYIDFFCQMV